MKVPFAVALLFLLTLCIASPVTFVIVEPSTDDSIINIDVCNSGKAFPAGCGMSAVVQMAATSLFPRVSAFSRPVSSFVCLSVAPTIAEPPPKGILPACL